MLDTGDSKLPHDFLIAQCNNCFLYFESIEEMLLQPIRDLSPLISEEELEAHFN